MLKYTTEQKVEQYLNITIDPSISAQIEGWIAAMSRFADKHCNRTLMVETAETRTFKGAGSRTLYIDEACEIVSVTPDGGTALAASDYTTLPANRPYILAIYGEGRYFDYSDKYLVNAFFGHIKAENVTDGVPENVPDELQLAVTMLVGELVNLSRNGGDDVQSEKVGLYSYTVKDLENKQTYKTAVGLLNQYRRLAL